MPMDGSINTSHNSLKWHHIFGVLVFDIRMITRRRFDLHSILEPNEYNAILSVRY